MVSWQCRHLTLDRDSRYRISFRARADAPRDIQIQLCESEPFNVLLEERVQLTTDWRHCELEHLAQRTTEPAILMIPLGSSSIGVEFADFVSEQDGVRTPVDSRLSRYSVSYRTNNFGFRDQDYVIPRPADSFRIICLGDSFTWGQGVHERDVYVKVLERLLNEHQQSSSVNFEVINCGRSGYSTREERGCFECQAAEYQPNLVVLQMCENDNQSSLPTKEGVVAQSDLRRSYLGCAEQIGLLAKQCRSMNCELVVFLFRLDNGSFGWRRLVADIAPTLQTHNVHFLDFSDPRLMDPSPVPSKQLIVHKTDQHPNEIAHRLAAERIERALRKWNLLPEESP